MIYALMIITPLLVLLILAVFRFTGCSSFTAAPTPPQTVTGPPLVIAPPDTPPPTPVPTDTYEDLVTKKTAGFSAFWPLNEPNGNVAAAVSSLVPRPDGQYTSRVGVPAGTGYVIGQNGVLFPKEMNDRAPAFDGSAAYIEVPYHDSLNPATNVPGFSVEVWAKPNPTVGGVTQVLVSSHRFDSAGVQQGYEIALVKDGAQQNQQIRGRVFSNGQTGTAIVTPLNVDPASWRYIVLVWQLDPALGPTLTVHVRVPKTTNFSAGTFKDGPHGGFYQEVIAPNTSTLRFGAGHAVGQTSENYFYGQIDNVAFYNGVLDPGDMQKHFDMFPQV